MKLSSRAVLLFWLLLLLPSVFWGILEYFCMGAWLLAVNMIGTCQSLWNWNLQRAFRVQSAVTITEVYAELCWIVMGVDVQQVLLATLFQHMFRFYARHVSEIWKWLLWKCSCKLTDTMEKSPWEAIPILLWNQAIHHSHILCQIHLVHMFLFVSLPCIPRAFIVICSTQVYQLKNVSCIFCISHHLFNDPASVQVGWEVTVHQSIRYHNLIWITYALVTCPVNPYVHLDARHTNGCASMSSVTYVRAFLE